MTAPPLAHLLERMAAQGRTLAVAESLTGGLLASTIVGVPGASKVFRGGVVAYATDVKASVLGVDERLLAQRGPVDADVAGQLASRVARLLGADIGLGTTGVAGPEPLDGHPVGQVFVGLAVLGEVREVRELRLTGGRAQIRAASVGAALRLLATVL